MQRVRPANDHRGCCSAKDYEIRGRTGVIKVTGPCGTCAVFHVYMHARRVEDTEVHCAFIRLRCRQISSLERGLKKQEREWVALFGTMTVSGVM